MSVFSSGNFSDHESVHFFNDASSGLQAIIAVHNTARGPAAGGTRFWRYNSHQDAVDDVLNLSRAMSFKNAMANIPFGGGKAVILKPEGAFDRKALFEAYGRAVESLNGIYCTAEDVGVSPADMEIVSTQTRFVGGLNNGKAASGDPSPITAEGVFRGLKVAMKHKMGSMNFKDVRVAVQGLGHVGYSLCQKLHAAGADLIVTDINEAVLERAKSELEAEVTHPNDIYQSDVDIFAPCALGGAINPDTLDQIKAPIIGGAANNQLVTVEMGAALRAREILYCPDYVINGGGIINVAAELSGHYDPAWVDNKLDELSSTLEEIIVKAEKEGQPTNIIADRLAMDRIQQATVS